jgi:ABC-2 type transport system permease protein
MKTFYWLVKREFWEHKGGFLWAPIFTGGIFLLLNIMGIITAEVIGSRHGFSFGASNGLHQVIAQMNQGDLSKVGMALDLSMYTTMWLISVVMGFVVLFYCLGSLYDDRRDRSILFWKSLPISNTSTVLSKVASATILAPVIAIIVGVIVGIVQLLIVAVVLSFHGVNVWNLLLMAHPFKVIANMIGYVPLYLLWALPAVGWLMFCSAWSRSKPFLWAVAVPVIAGVMISWFDIMGFFNLSASWFWQNVVQRILFSVWPGSNLFASLNHGGDQQNLDFLNLGQTYQLLGTANLWIGVIAGLALLAGAVWFRRTRDDS